MAMGRWLLAGGVLAGAGVGAYASDASTVGGRLRAAGTGALVGAGLGAGTWAATSRSMGARLARGSARIGYGAGKAGLKGGGGVMQWALRKPSHAIGLAGVGAGLYGASTMVGSGRSGMDAEEAAAIMQMHGGPSTGFAPTAGTSIRQEQRAMFMDSTFGLTQGLHRGRHR